MSQQQKNAKQPRSFSCEMDDDLITQIDDEAERMQAEDTYGRRTNRSETVRTLIADGLRARAERRAQQQPKRSTNAR